MADANEVESTSVPKGAKQPQDRKPKDDKPKVEQVEIDTPTGEVDDEGKPKTRKVKASRVAIRGIVVTVPHEALDDFEVLDDMRALHDEEDASRMPSLLRRLIGDDYKRVMNALRGTNGRVGVEDGTKFVWDLVGALGQGN
ncbi:MAG: hypothetical protein BGN97_00230 [Microbacterium sp. 69-10]|uniref:hypothetical protein n=1 Tax=Microbacterium sp. 69-10 TaxID=1895783 RepID=UPI000969D2C9|nr:hypothetical protein [Microbacterium sp. 69-10]OJU39682.1 MAG: hypothetical protein BGN97_00230 [Microbacterium sp. 69-10]